MADEKRICPVCQAPMVKHFCSSKKLINIDECYTCGGIFLDYGELEFIRKQYATEQERINAFNEDVLPLVEVKLQETLDKFDKFNKQSITKRWADALTSMIFGKYY